MAAREALVQFEEMMSLKGQVYRDIYRMYENSLERCNDRLDLCETYDYEDEVALIASFRENGVEEFTFSSRWSSAVESAWKFIQNGCTLVGMIEINGRFKLRSYDMVCEGYEKVPAYLFRVN